MSRYSVLERSRWHILMVGLDLQPARIIEACLRKAVSNGDFVSIDYLESLPRIGLDRYAAILIDVRTPDTEREWLARAPDLAWRSRTVLDLNACRPERVWRQMRSGSLPAIAVGPPAEEHRLQQELARLLLADPVLAYLEPVLTNVCSHPQRLLVTAFLRYTRASLPQHVAATLARAPRSLSRDCAALGLNPPQVLVKVARIARGVTLAVLRQLTISSAARVAGYHHSSSFCRATRNTFGVSVAALLREWDDLRALEARFSRVLLRRE